LLRHSPKAPLTRSLAPSSAAMALHLIRLVLCQLAHFCG
jgi:hypothetical protein